MIKAGSFIWLLPALAMLTFASVRLDAQPFANFEAAQTNPIRLSPDGSRLFVVNTPAGTVSVFDLTIPQHPALLAEIPVGVEPVSVNPLGNNLAWVINQVSDSISEVSVSRGIVTRTIYAPDEPSDVVFANGKAFVSISRDNQVNVYDVLTHEKLATIDLFGGNPRALAVSPDRDYVYVAFAISGNRTTLMPFPFAPLQPNPENPDLPAPPPVGLIIKSDDPQWSDRLPFTLPDNDVAVLSTGDSPALVRYYSSVGTINFALDVDPVTGNIFVANTEALNHIRFEPNLRGHFVDNRISRIDVASGDVTPYDLNPTINYSILPNPAARSIALATPTAVVFNPDGLFMYVAAFGTDRIARVRADGVVLARIEIAPWSQGAGANVYPPTKRGPRGLALNAATAKLYVANRISNTITVIDTDNDRVLTELPIGINPTPEVIRLGRGFLYDAKLSGNGTASCASCHVDGDMDHLAWDLGDAGGDMTSTTQGEETIEFHPMKGPMVTQTLRGLLGLEPLHWRGDKADLGAFNPAFDSLMGGSQLSSLHMSVFAEFIDSILFQPNPNQTLDRDFHPTIFGGNPAQGLDDFVNVKLSIPLPGSPAMSCNECHLAPPGPGSDRLIDSQHFNQPMKTPQLRNLYQKLLANSTGPSIDGVGMNSDGRLASLPGFFNGQAFQLYNAQQRVDIVAFLLSFDTGTAPAVGFTRTLDASNVNKPGTQWQWGVLEAQAAAGNIDLVVRGTFDGTVGGLLYRPVLARYVSDRGAILNRDVLQTLIENGDTMSFMGVYPGTGQAAAPAQLDVQR